MACQLLLRESMVRVLIVFMLLGFSGGAMASGDCLVPLKVRRPVRDSCWVSVLTTDSVGQVELCLPRSTWVRWLALKNPSCLAMPGSSPGRWAEIRPVLFDQTAPPEGRPSRRRFISTTDSGHFRAPSGEGALTRVLLRGTQWLERRREAFSLRLRPQDPTGWLRAWILGESPPREPASEGLPTVLFFLLGYVHLLTSAGVHLLMMGVVMEFVVTTLDSRWSARVVRPVRTGLSFLQWSAFLWIWALAGWRWGLIRPLILMAIQQRSRALGWRWEKGWPLIFSVLLEAVLAASMEIDAGWGRLHYLLAVWGGLWGAAGRAGWRAHVGMALGSWMALVPVQVFHDGWIAASTPLLSLVTIPVAGYVLLPSVLLWEAFPGMPGLGAFVHFVSSGLLELTIPIARIPGMLWSIPVLPAVLAIALVLLVRSAARRRWRTRVLIGLVAAAGASRAISPPASSAPMEMTANEVVQLDVGQGDAALVSWNEGGRSRIAAIDVGSARATDPSQWIRALARRGATQLDAVVLTHLDEDHSGVLAQLLPWIRIRCVILPPTLAPDDAWPVRRLLAERGIPVGHEASSCFPFPWQFTIHDSGPNGVMGGVLVPLRDGGAYLNLGDAGRQGHGASEMALAEAFRRDWPDLWGRARASQRLTLKLGHHGARTASSEELLKAFPPARAVVSSGWQNRYGHPHPETLERMRRVGVAVERTDLGGALIIQ